MERPPNAGPSARRYQPSVNITRAPAASVPLPFMVAGWGFLIWAVWELAAARASFAGGVFGALPVVAAVHGVTLGFLTLTMTGFLYQWIPVVFDVPPLPRWFSWSEGAVHTLGLLMFLDGWLAGVPGRMAVGGALLSVALLALAVAAGMRVAESRRPRDTVTAAVALSLVGLTATWVMGLLMAIGLAEGQASLGWLALHISVALAAWVATLVSGVQLKLVPMFSMSRAAGRLTALPLVFLWLGVGAAAAGHWLSIPGTLITATVFWFVAAVGALVLITRIRRAGKAPEADTVFVTVIAGWGLWAMAAVLILVSAPLAVIAALGGGIVMVLGYQARLAPFMVALASARRLPGPPEKAFFMARSMGSRLAPLLTGYGMPLAVALLMLAVARHQGGYVLSAVFLVTAAWVGSTGSMAAAAVRARRRQPGPVTPAHDAGSAVDLDQ